MNKSMEERLGVETLNSATLLIQIQPRRLPPVQSMSYAGLGKSNQPSPVCNAFNYRCGGVWKNRCEHVNLGRTPLSSQHHFPASKVLTHPPMSRFCDF